MKSFSLVRTSEGPRRHAPKRAVQDPYFRRPINVTPWGGSARFAAVSGEAASLTEWMGDSGWETLCLVRCQELFS
jgi:hypothetical protein